MMAPQTCPCCGASLAARPGRVRLYEPDAAGRHTILHSEARCTLARRRGGRPRVGSVLDSAGILCAPLTIGDDVEIALRLVGDVSMIGQLIVTAAGLAYRIGDDADDTDWHPITHSDLVAQAARYHGHSLRGRHPVRIDAARACAIARLVMLLAPTVPSLREVH